MKRLSICCGLSLLGAFCPSMVLADEPFQLKSRFLAEGVTARTGGYRPIRAQMDVETDEAKKLPEELENPKLGQLSFGDQSFLFLLDEPEEGEAKLFVDSNADGDLTNDPAPVWKSKTTNDLTMYNGSAKIEIDGQLAKVNLYRFDPTDERRKSLANTVLYYGDFGSEYSFEVDGKEFKTAIAGLPKKGARLSINRDENPRISSNFETVIIGKPFNFTGTTLVFSVADAELKLDRSAEEMEQLPLPPDLRIGKPALEFTAKTMKGDEVKFPSDFAGKLVMLDMWATWCGPCIGEIPHMKEAYEKHHENGFEILGISFDREGMEDKVTEFLEENELPWNQVYEGKGWDTSVGEQYDVSGIPFVLLVDGDSGKILATASQLRGEKLAGVIEEKLAEKSGTPASEESK